MKMILNRWRVDMEHSENGIGVGTLQVIADFQLERWLHTLRETCVAANLESCRCTNCREDGLHGNKFDMAIHQ